MSATFPEVEPFTNSSVEVAKNHVVPRFDVTDSYTERREVHLEMGFTEMVDEMVISSQNLHPKDAV